MTSKRFVISSLGLTVVVIASVAVAAWFSNLYGLFGNVTGKSYRPYHPYARVSKYLFTYNYIPSNFDALLHGASTAANWEVRKISKYRVYNCAMQASTIAEQRLILESALNRGKFRLVVFVVNGHFLHGHEVNDASFEPSQYWASLGSPRLVGNTLAKASVDAGILKNYFDDHGTQTFRQGKSKYDAKNAGASGRGQPHYFKVGEFKVDPVALEIFKSTIDDLRSRKVTAVLVYPPYCLDNFPMIADEFKVFQDQLNPLFAADGAHVLDLNDGHFDDFRKDTSNYFDDNHFTLTGQEKIVEELNVFLTQIDSK